MSAELSIIEIVRNNRCHRSVKRLPLADGVQGTLQTLQIMAEMVREDSINENVNDVVKANILKEVASHDDGAEIQALFLFWRSSIAWRRDPRGVERIADFISTARAGYGDCGDKSVGLATSLAAIGHTPYFVVLSQFPPDPVTGEYTFNHVYVGVRQRGAHYALDPTPNDDVAGWEAAGEKRFYQIFDN